MSHKIGRNDPCFCGSGKKYKVCHGPIDDMIEGARLKGHLVPSYDMLKTEEQLQGIRESSRINIAVPIM